MGGTWVAEGRAGAGRGDALDDRYRHTAGCGQGSALDLYRGLCMGDMFIYTQRRNARHHAVDMPRHSDKPPV